MKRHRIVASMGIVLALSGCIPPLHTSRPAHGGSFRVPPRTLVHAGQTYQLAFRQNTADGQWLSEYTHNNEPVTDWSQLVTVNYFAGFLPPPARQLQALEHTLRAQTPLPYFSLYQRGEVSYATIIYPPGIYGPHFEADVQKYFFLPACGGMVLYQYAVKYPAPPADADREALLVKIRAENRQAAEAMEQNDWQPDCG